jgi:hypothetical protein
LTYLVKVLGFALESTILMVSDGAGVPLLEAFNVPTNL